MPPVAEFQGDHGGGFTRSNTPGLPRAGDRTLWASAARDGAAALADMHTEVAESLSPPERAVVQRFLGSLVIHLDHHTDDASE